MDLIWSPVGRRAYGVTDGRPACRYRSGSQCCDRMNVGMLVGYISLYVFAGDVLVVDGKAVERC